MLNEGKPANWFQKATDSILLEIHRKLRNNFKSINYYYYKRNI